MKRGALLAAACWLGVVTTTVGAAACWRAEIYRPHAMFGGASLLLISAPAIMLAAVAVTAVVRGPRRCAAGGWLIAGLTPLAWLTSFLGIADVKSMTREPMELTAPLRTAAVWASSLMDLHARAKFPRWTRGEHAILLDDGHTPHAHRLVREMDGHLRRMAKTLEQPVPSGEFPWVRGSLLGVDGHAVGRFALCGHADRPAELTGLDRHEMAHTLITAMAGPDQYPPMLLAEGWAQFCSADHDDEIRFLAAKFVEGTHYDLTELVHTDWYVRDEGPVYWVGGPVARFLIERFGGEKFFELYRQVRPTTFDADCRRVLGVGWSEIEADFWPWVRRKAADLEDRNDVRRASGWRLDPSVQLTEGVDPAAWKTLCEGCLQGRSRLKELVRTGSLSVETTDFSHHEVDPARDPTLPPAPWRILNRGDRLWMVDEQQVPDEPRFVLIGPERSADLRRRSDGSLQGEMAGPAGARRIRCGIDSELTWHCHFCDPWELLPKGSTRGDAEVRSLKRGTKTDPQWSVTIAYLADEPARQELRPVTEVSFTVDPSRHWLISSATWRQSDSGNSVSHWTNEFLSTGIVPVISKHRFRNTDRWGESVVEMRELTAGEQAELQQRVEAIADRGPTLQFLGLRRLFAAISWGFPLAAMSLLAASFRLDGGRYRPSNGSLTGKLAVGSSPQAPSPG